MVRRLARSTKGKVPERYSPLLHYLWLTGAGERKLYHEAIHVDD